ncbi:RDD family protein [Photobacterium toruni]|uniref:RDD family protein n=1 Tax=Photobacterium toruni TaxID=1935446 RepID=A0A1T4PAT1_9GAMM|nr:RDD family protein [Photobacterium toruni]MEC6815770.1 RDD family protein [Photobacterium toruni]SJZ88457.1 RDD family protein [Photobacterium toruni]
MSFKLKYRRIGTFMIDMAIVQMFAMVGRDIYLGIIAYISNGTGATLSLNDTMALPALLLLFMGLMLLFIGVFMGYQWICYRLLGTSLSRYLLSVQVVATDEQPLTKQRYLKREFNKIYLCVATLGLYPLYCGAQYLAFSNPPWHDRTNHTTVVER